MRKLLEKKRIVKSFSFDIKAVDNQNHVVRGTFSTPIEDRQGEAVNQSGWNLDNYKLNPVVLWAHDAYQFPIAQMIEIEVVNGNLEGAMKFAVDEYETAATAYALVVGKYIRAFSVGFQNSKYEIDQEEDTVFLIENELYEVSLVNVPANQLALAKSKGIDISPFELESKSVVPYADHGTAPEDTAWDGPAQVMECGDDIEKLKAICAWFDSENPEVKSSYKLPHHLASDKKAVWKGVAAAMSALLGGRGGVDMPEGDRQGVYNHLAKHYKAFDKEVPEFKSYSEEELKQIEIGTFQEEKAIDTIKSSNTETIRSAIRTLQEVLKAKTEADSQVGGKVEHSSKEGGNKKIPVHIINQAVKELLKIKKSQ